MNRYVIAAATALLMTTSVAANAAAEPPYCDPDAHPEGRSVGLAVCLQELWDDAATQSKSDSPAFLEWIGDNKGFLLLSVLGVVIFMAARRRLLNQEAATAEAERQMLARGRQIAAEHHATRVRDAEEAAAQQIPPSEEYDPLGLGVAPPPAPKPVLPPEPEVTDDDARRHARYGRYVEWIPGSAFATLTVRDGRPRIEAAWKQAVEAAGVGERDEDGTFTPAAEAVRVDPADNGDAIVVVKTADLTADAQLEKITPYFLRAGRLATVEPWARIFRENLYGLRVSNNAPTTPEPVEVSPLAQLAAEDDEWA